MGYSVKEKLKASLAWARHKPLNDYSVDHQGIEHLNRLFERFGALTESQHKDLDNWIRSHKIKLSDWI